MPLASGEKCIPWYVVVGDEIGGLSVSIRDRDDVIQIWNVKAELAEQATIEDRVKALVPKVAFYAVFYKGGCQPWFCIKM